MAVSKFYARYVKSNNDFDIINAFEALKLKNNAKIDTSSKNDAVLYDIETNLKVTPSKGRKISPSQKGQPYFKYYPGEDSPLKGQPSTFEYSSEINIFLEAFKSIKNFQISNIGTHSDDNITLFVKNINRLHRINSDDGQYFILKVLIELEDTKPYSAYYRLNGVFGIEFYKTSQPTPAKRVKLGEMGIPLFEAKAIIPNYTEHLVKDEFENSQELTYLAEEVRNVYENKNYNLLGYFNKYHLEHFQFLEDNERKYRILKSFEEKQQELQQNIKQLENSFSQKRERINQLNEQITQIEARIREYNANEEYYRKLKHENELLKSKNSNLEEKSNHISNERDSAIQELKSLKNKSWLQRLFNK